MNNKQHLGFRVSRVLFLNFTIIYFNAINTYQLIKRMAPKRKRTDDKNQFTAASAAANATNDYDDDDIRSLLISLERESSRNEERTKRDQRGV